MTTSQFLAENEEAPQNFEYQREKIEDMMRDIYDFHTEDRF